MAVPIGGIIAAAGAVAGAGINAASTGKMNKKSRRFSEHMYNRQSADYLKNWNLQNDYNSPQAQMKRFQEAGLNPNLIYGQGNSGPSGSIGVPDPQPVQFKTPEWGNMLSGGLGYMSQIYDLAKTQAQTNNLQAQSEVLEKEKLYKDMLYQRGMFDLDFESELRPISAEARVQGLEKLKTDISTTISRLALDSAKNSSDIKEAGYRMASMVKDWELKDSTIKHNDQQIAQSKATTEKIRKEIDLLDKEGVLKDWEIRLSERGFTPGTPLWQKSVASLVQGIYDKVKGIDPAKIKPGLHWSRYPGK